jgi:hypothetical protein
MENIGDDFGNTRAISSALFSFTAGSLFTFTVTLSQIYYFTTWALIMHAFFFFTVGSIDLIRLWDLHSVFFSKFQKNTFLLRWIFAPLLATAVSVAVTVTCLLYFSWVTMYAEYCTQSIPCRNLLFEFIVAHYIPVMAYSVMYMLNDDLISSSRRIMKIHQSVLSGWSDKCKNNLRYWLLLCQLSMIPVFVYSTVYDLDGVYGNGSLKVGSLVYGLTLGIWTIIWSFPR